MLPYILEAEPRTPKRIQQLVVFYLRATERFRTFANSQVSGMSHLDNYSLAYGALAEALNWADTIDQYLREGPRKKKGSPRDQDWASQGDGTHMELVRAFRHARNHVHHQWSDLIGTRCYTPESERASEWYWATIPSSASATWRKSAREDYENFLQGNCIQPTLDQLGEAFWERRTWQISLSMIRQPGHEVGAALNFDPDISI